MDRMRITPVNWGLIPTDGTYNNVGGIYKGSVMRAWTDTVALQIYWTAYNSRNTSVGIPSNTCLERIVEDRTGGAPKSKFNRVWHSKQQVVNLPFLGGFAHAAGDNYNGYCRKYWREAIVAAPAPTVEEDILHTIPRDQFRSRAWASMQPRFEGEVSLINTLFELKDFRDIAKLLLSRENMFELVQSFRKSFYKKRKETPWFDPSVPASRALLTWNLAIIPTIRDVKAIIEQYASKVWDVQREFAAAGKETQTTHYTEWYVHEDTRAVPTSGDYFWMQKGTLYKTKLTATLKYKYDYRLRSYTDAVRKYWGLTGSWEAVWNMLPMSFLLDYIVQIGKAIRFAERDDHVILHDTVYGESYKITHQTGTWFHDHSRLCFAILDGIVLNTPEGRNNGLISGASTSVYSRDIATPFKGLVIPRFKRPSERQLFNIASLARLLFA